MDRGGDAEPVTRRSFLISSYTSAFDIRCDPYDHAVQPGRPASVSVSARGTGSGASPRLGHRDRADGGAGAPAREARDPRRLSESPGNGGPCPAAGQPARLAARTLAVV